MIVSQLPATATRPQDSRPLRAVRTANIFIGGRANSRHGDIMTSPTTTNDSSGTEYANLTVSAEFRDKIRVAKAKQGVSYEDYLRQHLPDDIAGTA